MRFLISTGVQTSLDATKTLFILKFHSKHCLIKPMKNNVLVNVRKIYPFKALETKKGVINKLNVSMRQIENYYPCEKKKIF